MIINHNISAMNTYRQLTINNAFGSKSLEKLSSGLRINRPATMLPDSPSVKNARPDQRAKHGRQKRPGWDFVDSDGRRCSQ